MVTCSSAPESSVRPVSEVSVVTLSFLGRGRRRADEFGDAAGGHRRISHMSNTYDWASRGACRTADPDTLFVQGAAQNRVKTMCMSCPVRTECLADALDNRIEFGVWGGMTERERR